MSKEIDPQAIPKAACTFQATEFHLGDNGEDARTAPIRMLARSSKPIEHWYWGNVAHDISGYNLNGKTRIPIDFDHDTGEAIGFINKFEQTEEGLVLSGTLVSHYKGDRADRIMKDQRAGIPYESSINFGGDGIEIERVPAGKSATVNGYELAGEAQVIRKWPLRGVALTLYGADGNTNSKVFKDGGTVSASVITKDEEAGDNMSKPKELNAEGVGGCENAAAPVEAVKAAETVANPEEVAEEATELSQAVEAVEVEALAAVDAEAVEVEVEEDHVISAREFTRIVTDFGAEVAAEVVTNNGTYGDALRLAYSKLVEENKALKANVAELSANPRTASTAVSFSDGERGKKKPSMSEYFNSKLKGE